MCIRSSATVCAPSMPPLGAVTLYWPTRGRLSTPRAGAASLPPRHRPPPSRRRRATDDRIPVAFRTWSTMMMTMMMKKTMMMTSMKMMKMNMNDDCIEIDLCW